MVGDAPINSGNNFDCTDQSQQWPTGFLLLSDKLCYTCEPTGNTANKCSRYFFWELGCCTDTVTYDYTDIGTIPFVTRTWNASFIERTFVEMCLTLERYTPPGGSTVFRIIPRVRLGWQVKRTYQIPESYNWLGVTPHTGYIDYFSCPYTPLACPDDYPIISEFKYSRAFVGLPIEVTDCYDICGVPYELTPDLAAGADTAGVLDAYYRDCPNGSSTDPDESGAYSLNNGFFSVTDESGNEPLRLEPCRYEALTIQFSGCTPPEVDPPPP